MAQGAPKGNQFWKLRSKHGREKLFNDHSMLWDAACEYFQWVDDTPFKEQHLFHNKGKIIKSDATKLRPYTIHGLCIYLGCNTKYLNDFNIETTKDPKGFSEVITRIRETIYNQKFEGAAAGFFNSNIIARDLGLKDKSEVEGKHRHEFENMSDEDLDRELDGDD